MGKGTDGERALAILFFEAGFIPMRGGSSGAGTDRPVADVLVGDGARTYAIEAKKSSEKPIYIDPGEVNALKTVAAAFRGTATLAVKFRVKRGDPAWGDGGNPGWYFLDPDDCHTTPDGNYRIKKETALDDGTPFAELVDSD